MTIDEAIAHAKEVSSRKFDDNVHCIRCSEFHKQIAEWLEEYKRIKMLIPIEQALKAEYNKAIDDFVRFANTMPTVESEDGTIRPMWLEEIAEQLKEGAGNDKSI